MEPHQSFGIIAYSIFVILALFPSNSINFITNEIQKPLLLKDAKGRMTKIDETYESLVDNSGNGGDNSILFKNKDSNDVNNLNGNGDNELVLNEIPTKRKNLHINNNNNNNDDENNNNNNQETKPDSQTKEKLKIPKRNRFKTDREKTSKGKKKRITENKAHPHRSWKSLHNSFVVVENPNKNKLCDDVLCNSDEYCFIPEVGIAECLKNPIQQPMKQRQKKKIQTSNLISFGLATNNNEENELDYDGNLMDDFGLDFENEDDDEHLHHHHHHYSIKKINSKPNYTRKDINKFKQLKQEIHKSKLDETATIKTDRRNGYQRKTNDDLLTYIKSGNQIMKNHHQHHHQTQLPNKDSKIIHCPSCPFTKGQIICGTDNFTYSSMCRIEFHNCIHSTNVKFACFGFCPCTKVFNQEFSNDKNNNNNNNNNNINNINNNKNNNIKEKKQLSNESINKNLKPNNFDLDFDLEKNTHITLKNSSQDLVLTKEMLSQYHYDVDSSFIESPESIDSNRRNNKKYFKNKQSSCSTEELRSMGFRLLDWFTVVMKEELKRKTDIGSSKNETGIQFQQKYLPDCEEQVSFMFYHFDTDHNYKLSSQELYYLEHDENEHCLEPYLIDCDEDENDILSAYEWCSCFSLRSKPCLYQRKHIIKSGLNGQYVPQCDEKGHYRNVQCHSANNFCWCSDKNGNEIAGTRIRDRRPICDKSYPLNRFQRNGERIYNNNNNNNNHHHNHNHNYNKNDDAFGRQLQPSSSFVNINEDTEDDDDENDNFSWDRGSGFDSF